MKILVSIDDTDDLDSVGTGELAEMMAANLETKGWGKGSAVSRHQLLVHPDIPYTSHNSSMCFAAEMEGQHLESFIDYAKSFLESQSAPGSDPGLCVAIVDHIDNPALLVDFGHKAKHELLTKEAAYELAEELNIHLSEHGGTGQGVIGALAGAGLRLSGSDGRFKGKVRINTAADGTAAVREIREQAKADEVRSVDGKVLCDEERVYANDWLKLVLLDNKAVMLVNAVKEDDPALPKWRACSKQQTKKY